MTSLLRLRTWGGPVLSVIVALCFTISPCLAPPSTSWTEDKEDDAGSGPTSSQKTKGSGKVDRVSGALTGVSSFRAMIQDEEDVFVVWVADPEAFQASLRSTDNGSASFDASLYLFTPDTTVVDELFVFNEMFGLLGVQDVQQLGALLPAVATDSTGVLVTEPGYYMLAVSSATRYPTILLGGFALPIFSFISGSEVSGPDGDAGSLAFTETEGFWEGTPATGFYDVALDGVGFAFPSRSPGNDALPTDAYVEEGVWPIYTSMASTESQADVTCVSPDGTGQVLHHDLWWSYEPVEPGLIRVSTCDRVDFDSVIAVYLEKRPCRGDINSDGVVDVVDFSVLMVQWDSSGPEADLNGDGTVDINDFSLFLIYFGSCQPDLELVACQDDSTACAAGTSEVFFTTDGTEKFLIRIGGPGSGDRGRGTFSVKYD